MNSLMYVKISKGSETEANCDMIYKLLKALYSLKQSLCFWYKQLLGFLLEKLGLMRINIDHSILVIKEDLDGSIVNMFIDDIKIMAPKESRVIN